MFSGRLSLGLSLSLGSAAALAALAAALALRSKGALTTFSRESLLAQLLVVRERAGIPFRAIPVIPEVEADLACCSLTCARTGRQGVCAPDLAAAFAAALRSLISFCALAKAAAVGSAASPGVLVYIE